MLILLLLAVIFVFILYKLSPKWGRPARFPPGPPVLPLVGSIPFLGIELPRTFKNWRTKYGDIIGLKVGSINVVVLNNQQLIREAYSQEAFAGLFILESMEDIVTGGNVGVVTFQGKKWTEQRTFQMKNLKDFGFGKPTMEVQIQEDITDLIQTLKTKCDQPLDPAHLFKLAILNSLWQIVAGERFELSDPKFNEIAEKFSAGMHVGLRAAIVFFLPKLAELIPELSGRNSIKRAFSSLHELLQGLIDNHKKIYQEDNLRDYMDVYLREIYSTTNPNSSFYKNQGAANMLFGSILLFEAGSETTALTLIWACFLLMKNPHVQKKLQKEIDSVVGASRLPGLNDRPNMPYAQAVIQEVFRMSSLAAVGVGHRTMEDVEYRGYKIPKGTAILANFYAHHHDEEIWGDPQNFRPERFLTHDEKQIQKGHPTVYPFSVGQRVCPGETIARNNFFLFITSIFQRFSVRKDPNSTEGKASLALLSLAPQVKYIFEDRQ